MTDLRREPPHPQRGELPIRREPCKMDGISEHIVISRHRPARARPTGDRCRRMITQASVRDPRLSLARCATSWVFFANGAALGSWVPHIPDAKQALDLGEG